MKKNHILQFEISLKNINSKNALKDLIYNISFGKSKIYVCEIFKNLLDFEKIHFLKQTKTKKSLTQNEEYISQIFLKTQKFEIKHMTLEITYL